MNGLNLARSLQGVDPVVDPCAHLNEQWGGNMTCTCIPEVPDRKKETEVTCMGNFVDCNWDNSSCFVYGQLMTLNTDNVVTKFTTYSNETMVNSDDRELHVTVTPNAPGDFSSITDCETKLNGETCNYCHLCSSTSVAIDCCNVVPDTVQSECVDVLPGGVLLAEFDALPDTPGQCAGEYAYSAGFKIMSLMSAVLSALTLI